MRRGAAIFIILLTLPVAYGQETASAQSDAERCPDLEHIAGVGDVCRRENGLLEVYAPDGRSLGFTHGPDPLCMECASEPDLAAAGSTTPLCVAGTAGEYYVRVIYARAFDDTDRYASMASTVRNLVGGANAMVDDAAIATGDRLSIRVKCAAGVVVVDNVVLPTSRSGATYATVIRDLEGLGYTDIRTKHWVYYDDGGACACSGIGHIYDDETDSVNNANNGPFGTSPMFAISFDSPSVRTLLHELAHNLGAVQDSAPRSSGSGHCTDGRDTMCYDDGGPNSGACQPDFSCSGVCSVEVFDCNKDTYCHANPPTGSWLDTRWQACSRFSRFLQFADNLAPTMTALSCAPSPSVVDEVVTCSFAASDGNVGVYYRVAWGDGATTRVPATGVVAPGTTQTATHAYASVGDRTVAVNATDGGTPAMTSANRTVLQGVGPANTAPVLSPVSCAPSSPAEGQTITCSFSSTDVHNVSYQVSWGDGSPSVRVPASGVVPAAAAQSASNVYGRGGTFAVNVTATDDGRPALSSAPSTATLAVAEVNTAPVMSSLACPTAILRVGGTFACSFAASDDSTGVRYRVDWGDGNVTFVPETGFVVPGTTRNATHAYWASADHTVTVSATDDSAPPATGAPLTSLLRIRSDFSPPEVVFTDPRNGVAYLGCGQSFSKVTGRPLMVGTGCVRATVTDPSGVARVDVLRQGVLLARDIEAPYELEYPVPGVGNGVTFELKAYDTLGFVRTERFVVDSVGGSE